MTNLASRHSGSFASTLAKRLARASRRFHAWTGKYRDVGLTLILLIQGSIMFVVGPLAGAGQMRADIVEALRIAGATTAILIVNRRLPIGLAVALTFVVSMLCSTYVKGGAAGEAVRLSNIALTIAFDVAVAWIVAHAAFDAGEITVHRIMGAVILYLYIGLIFAGLYRVELILFHTSFAGLSGAKKGGLGEMLYFSMGALTTAGSGSIVPIHPLARSLAMLESVIGQLYPATFIARLVTLHGTTIESRPAQRRHSRSSPTDG